MAFSFPYPKLGTIVRPRGQGCLSCVHNTYCPAVYWLRRYGIERRTFDDHIGIQCSSWSSNMADQIKTGPTEDDMEEQDYQEIHGTASEPDRNGISGEITGSNRGS
jgi:hypothetical protein